MHKGFRRSCQTLLSLTALALSSPSALASDSPSVPASSPRMIYVDRELAPDAVTGGGGERSKSPGAPRRALALNPLVEQLEAGLAEYRDRWGSLSQLQVPAGPALRTGASGPRVRALRARFGLAEEGTFDAELAELLVDYKQAHGLGSTPIADATTLQSLNRGAGYYERIVEANIARARALPAELGRRYVLVDTAAARLSMFEDGRMVDSMRVIVGRPGEHTPMLAAYVRYAVLNPYWNVPPDLVRRRIAPNVGNLGLSYLEERGYEVLSGFGNDAVPVDPATVDWAAVAAGREEVRVRQRPGPGNMMGSVKFMLSDQLGIYLHDTPDRQLFASDDRRQSSGCIRLEDPRRLGRWLFGRPLVAHSDAPELRVDLPEPVPVYVTYLTVAPGENGLVFRDDSYGLDRQVLASLSR